MNVDHLLVAAITTQQNVFHSFYKESYLMPRFLAFTVVPTVAAALAFKRWR